ncbi:NUDIX domain-containing protein [Streptomyces sp. LN699]|uniref:NUDIX domain-containing protein n=1 Tax=Streptomyces sp. LN699 TaxID=3112981 RepID=UPI003717CFB5
MTHETETEIEANAGAGSQARTDTGAGRTYASHYADVHLLVRDGERLLMGRRRHDQPVFPGAFQVPAGLMEKGAPARGESCRELLEEVGLTAEPDDLRFVHLMHHVSIYNGHARIAFFFEVDRWTGTVGNPEPDKCEGWAWYACGSLPEPMPDYLRTALRYIARGVPYSEYRWPATGQAVPCPER